MKINQHVKFWTSYNTKIFKISPGFSSKLKPYNSINLAIGRACLHGHFCACQLCFKKPSEDQNIDHLDHLHEAILCDSYYVFRGFARGVSVVNFVFPRRPPSGPALRIRCVNEPSANAPTHEGAFAEGASESVSHGLPRECESWTWQQFATSYGINKEDCAATKLLQ